MCKVQMLRALVEQRLIAAAEEIFGLFERTIAEYEEELCRSKEENERQRELLDSVFNPQLRLHRADVEQLLMVKEEVPAEQQECSSSVDQQEPEPPPHIKEEQEELWSSEEGEQLQGLEEADITEFPFTPVPVKSEDDEEKAQSSQLHQRQTQRMKTEADGDDCGGPEPPRNSHPHPLIQPETEDQTGDSSEHDTDDSADWKETREPQSASNSLKHDSRRKKTFSCSECGRRFGQRAHLKRHIRSHTGEKPSSCSECDVQQLLVVKEEDPPEQQECSSSVDQQDPPHIKEEQEELWSSQQGEQRQRLEEADITKFPLTPFPVKSEDDEEEGLHQRRTEHMETEADGEEPARNSQPYTLFHPETGDSVDSDFWKESRERLSGFNSLEDDGCNTDRKSFSCSECGKRFGKFWCLRRHMRIHFGENYSVSQPGERTAIEEDKPQPPPHIKEEEEELFPFTPVPVKSEDDEKKGLPQRQTEHMETETEVSVDSDFWKETREPQSSLNSLKDEEVPVSEERRKTDKRSFSCSECGKRFGAVGDLNRHMRIHTGEKPFSCSVCCRRFLSSTHLKTHMLTHTGEKPFSCLFCDKRFRHSGNLTAHMNIHTGEKRFSCSVCDKTFTWRQQVKKHKCVQSLQLHRRQSEDKTADF